MAIIGLGSNISSLLAQRGLARATDDVARISTRLASGQRINSAGDDAAGLAIADSQKTQKRLYTTAIRNINDGISALSIASSSLESQNDLLTRMMEISEQAANGSFSSTQRSTLQNEYNQLRREFGRLAAVTQFNGISLLHGSKRGSLDSLNLQAGIEGRSTSTIGVSLGDSGAFSGVLDRTNLSYISSDISGATHVSTAFLDSTFGAGLFKISDDLTVGIVEDSGYGVIGVFAYRRDANAQTYSEVTSTDITYNATSGDIDASSVSALLAAGVDIRALKISDSTGQYGPNNGTSTNIEFTRIDSQAYARTALDTIRSRQSALSTLRGLIGAGQSRLVTATNVDQTLGLELGASESRIRDADIAAESAAYVAAQIRQRVATSVLAKANLQPQLVLRLLGA